MHQNDLLLELLCEEALFVVWVEQTSTPILVLKLAVVVLGDDCRGDDFRTELALDSTNIDC